VCAIRSHTIINLQPLRWDEDRTISLVHHIAESEIACLKLFPKPGQNPSTAKGGGVSKNEVYWIIARDWLSQDLAFSATIARIVKDGKPKEQTDWGKKIKNKVAT
jgi:hypothetical protein